MRFISSAVIALALRVATVNALSTDDFTLYADAVTLPSSFIYGTSGYDGRVHHTRTPFAVSDGGSAYVAYPDSTAGTIHVLQVDPTNDFAIVGDAVSIDGILVSGLVAHDDGFAVLINKNDGTTTNDEPTAYLMRYTDGAETWTTALNGNAVTDDSTIDTSSDVLTGDLVWNGSEYAAYFVVHGASGDYLGHYGDSIQYVSSSGTRSANDQYSNLWGCSHNEGIAIVATAEKPFLSLCSNDWQTGIYLNTDTRTMSGPKISNDESTAGYTGEPFGGEQGSYSVVSYFEDESALVAWSTHGAATTTDGGEGATMEVLTVNARWDVHNVAVAPLTDKSTPLTTVSLDPGDSGDDNVLYLTTDTDVDHVNVRTAAFDSSSKVALVTWESVTDVTCSELGTTCSGTYAGTSFQLVDGASGTASGSPVVRTDVFVSGDIRTLSTGELVWPYINVEWDLSSSASAGQTISKLSFAKLATTGTGSSNSTSSASATSSVAASSSAVAVSSTPVAASSSLPTTIAAVASAASSAVVSSAAASSLIASSAVASSAAVSSAAVSSAAVSSAIASSAIESAPASESTKLALTLPGTSPSSVASEPSATSAEVASSDASIPSSSAIAPSSFVAATSSAAAEPSSSADDSCDAEPSASVPASVAEPSASAPTSAAASSAASATASSPAGSWHGHHHKGHHGFRSGSHHSKRRLSSAERY